MELTYLIMTFCKQAMLMTQTMFMTTPYLSVFSPNAAKYRPEKTPYLDTLHTVFFFKDLNSIKNVF